MGRVRLLDPHTVSLIAAGEVILNPAMAAKELVENALDAGATHIEISCADGGYELLEVTDDGFGMSEEDCRLALLRHATSKLASADDLPSVASFGFRGEALPSMAAISRLTIETAEPSAETGFRIEIHGGTEISATRVPPCAGTRIRVRNLFYNSPVRLKFQKAPRSEGSRVAETVSRYALGRPDVAFRLTVDGKVRLATRPGSSLRENLVALHGPAFADGLRPVDVARAYPGAGTIRVHGFVSGPDLFHGNAKRQLLFVNGRPVENRAVSQAIRLSYDGILPHGRHPVAFLFLELEPGEADINVHPAKKEVVFAAERAVFSAVTHAVAEAFAAVRGFARRDPAPPDPAPRAPDADPFPTGSLFDLTVAPRLFAGGSGERAGVPPLHPVGADGPKPPHVSPRSSAFAEERGGSSNGRSGGPMALQRGDGGGAPDVPFPSPAPGGTPVARYIGRLFGTFLLAERDGELLVVDQHVASERVHYEELSKARGEGAGDAQALLVPVVVTPDPADCVAYEENLSRFRAVGFLVEPFGPGQFVVNEVPATLGPDCGRQAVVDLLDELLELLPARPDAAAERVIATAACKRAVKAGDRLGEGQAQALLASLFACENPWRCPHGRPIVVRVTLEDLLRKFGRI